MENEIRSCPFCGGEAHLEKVYSPKREAYFTFVQCDTCHARAAGYHCNEDPEEGGWTLKPCKRAVRSWNRRASEKTPA